MTELFFLFNSVSHQRCELLKMTWHWVVNGSRSANSAVLSILLVVCPQLTACSMEEGAGSNSSTAPNNLEFREVSLEEEIARASIIFRVEFEETSAGTAKAIIIDILKVAPGEEFPYTVGQEHKGAAAMAPGLHKYAEGALVIYTYSNDYLSARISRIRDGVTGLQGDPTIEEFSRLVAEVTKK